MILGCPSRTTLRAILDIFWGCCQHMLTCRDSYQVIILLDFLAANSGCKRKSIPVRLDGNLEMCFMHQKHETLSEFCSLAPVWHQRGVSRVAESISGAALAPLRHHLCP